MKEISRIMNRVLVFVNHNDYNLPYRGYIHIVREIEKKKNQADRSNQATIDLFISFYFIYSI